MKFNTILGLASFAAVVSAGVIPTISACDECDDVIVYTTTYLTECSTASASATATATASSAITVYESDECDVCPYTVFGVFPVTYCDVIPWTRTYVASSTTLLYPDCITTTYVTPVPTYCPVISGTTVYPTAITQTITVCMACLAASPGYTVVVVPATVYSGYAYPVQTLTYPVGPITYAYPTSVPYTSTYTDSNGQPQISIGQSVGVSVSVSGGPANVNVNVNAEQSIQLGGNGGNGGNGGVLPTGTGFPTAPQSLPTGTQQTGTGNALPTGVNTSGAATGTGTPIDTGTPTATILPPTGFSSTTDITTLPTAPATSTTEGGPSATTGAPTGEYTDPAFISGMLQWHNTYRENNQAPDVTWDTTLAEYAQNVANQCVFAHSGGPYGENLAEGTYTNPNYYVYLWYNEMSNYPFDNPGGGDFESYGHFTQVVWKASTTIGCGLADCSGSLLLVCEYNPRGNVAGAQEYSANVATAISQTYPTPAQFS